MCILCTIKHNRISESGPYLQKALRLTAGTRGFPSGSAVKNVPAILIPGSVRSSGRGHGNPPQYSCLENPMDRQAWWVTVRKVTKSQT